MTWAGKDGSKFQAWITITTTMMVIGSCWLSFSLLVVGRKATYFLQGTEIEDFVMHQYQSLEFQFQQCPAVSRLLFVTTISALLTDLYSEYILVDMMYQSFLCASCSTYDSRFLCTCMGRSSCPAKSSTAVVMNKFATI